MPTQSEAQQTLFDFLNTSYEDVSPLMPVSPAEFESTSGIFAEDLGTGVLDGPGFPNLATSDHGLIVPDPYDRQYRSMRARNNFDFPFQPGIWFQAGRNDGQMGTIHDFIYEPNDASGHRLHDPFRDIPRPFTHMLQMSGNEDNYEGVDANRVWQRDSDFHQTSLPSDDVFDAAARIWHQSLGRFPPTSIGPEAAVDSFGIRYSRHMQPISEEPGGPLPTYNVFSKGFHFD